MRLILTFILAFYLPFASASAPVSAQKSVTEFYQFYLGDFTNISPDNSSHKQKMTKWVSKKLLARLDAIYNIPEQEFLEADYFTYTQDYATEWIHRLRTTPGVADGNSQRVDVWLGIQDNKYKHLQAWTRKEDGEWKIWRVVDAGNHIEQKLY